MNPKSGKTGTCIIHQRSPDLYFIKKIYITTEDESLYIDFLNKQIDHYLEIKSWELNHYRILSSKVKIKNFANEYARYNPWSIPDGFEVSDDYIYKSTNKTSVNME